MSSQPLTTRKRRPRKQAPVLRAGDPVTYRVWIPHPLVGYVLAERLATVVWVRGPNVRLFTTCDGGKVFTLPIREVRHAHPTT